MFYEVGLQKSEEGYSVSCPLLHGCWSQGEAEAETLRNIRSAIQDYLVVLKVNIRTGEVDENL